MKRGGPLRRVTPIRQVSIRKRRQEAASRAFRALVRDRDLFQCQGCGKGPTAAREAGLRLEVQHRLPLSRGGRDDPANGVILCGFGNTAGCHKRVDHDRAWGYATGLTLHTGDDPGAVPITDWLGRSWLLRADGTRIPYEAQDGAA